MQTDRRPFLKPWILRAMCRRILLTPQYHPRPVQVPDWYSVCDKTAAPLRVSIVTPSFNQGRFLEQTIRSVLEQNYPQLQYIVQDGGSDDETATVLDRYRPQLHRCVQQKDRGQTYAINLGFQHADGEILAYLNSDDALLPGTLHYVSEFFSRNPDVDVIYSHRVVIDEAGMEVGRWVLPPHDARVLLWADFVPQETMFWRRRIWDKIGGQLDESFTFAMDWDLLLRFAAAGARFVRVPRFLAAFRVHPEQKTQAQIKVGLEEMAKLREQWLGRSVTHREVRRAIRRYKNRHILYHLLYDLGFLRH